MEFQFRVSVIVPIFNQEHVLENCINSLLAQTISPDEMEILLIDDGSTDKSPELCDSFAGEHSNVFVFHKENGGLSDARNCGISHARGKYLMYLDSDDALLPETVKSVCDFFDTHYSEVDLVTYPCFSVIDGTTTPLKHYRYNYMNYPGIYDLQESDNCFITITQIYICTKNKPGDNILFSPDRHFRHEDQKYCTDILLDKLKVGYCDKGGYLYTRHSNGLTGQFFFSYYLFERTMSFWEEEFGRFANKVPRYLQALYLSDVSWKISSDILFPYHYSSENFKNAEYRIDSLLSRCDVETIVKHPGIDKFRAAYLLQRKPSCDVRTVAGNNTLALLADGQIAYSRARVEIILLKLIAKNGALKVIGFLKSPCFQFSGKPTLIAESYIDGVSQRTEVTLTPSSWSYSHAKIKTNQFWGFEYEMNVSREGSLRFLVQYQRFEIDTNYYFMPRAVFSTGKPKRSRFINGEFEYSHQKGRLQVRRIGTTKKPPAMHKFGDETILSPRRRLYIASSLRTQSNNRRIWLYHDCHGVEKNNAYYQFMHDIQIEDGIERYYVVNDSIDSKRHLFSSSQMAHVIPFRSSKHKKLFLSAEKIITAYIEKPNWMAFSDKQFKYYADVFHAEIIYLQHGVLHAHLPWKYSADQLLIDKEVVSTSFEIDNLTANYGFKREQLIEAGMPRYDFMEATTKPLRKILLAPSWRKTLVQQKKDGQWAPVPDRFINSKFYVELLHFLNSRLLAETLEKYDYHLDFKLHPILNELYADFFHFDNPRIKRIDNSVDDTEYAIFITDFSSLRFDYVYLKRALMYFFPDKELFESGMYDYRKTDLPLDGTFGDMARTADEAISLLIELLSRDATAKPEHLAQMDDFFLFYDNKQCSRIYKALMD